MKRDEASLLEAVAGGDLPAFEELYRRYRRPVAGFLFRMTGDPRVVDELLNDVMLTVWEKAGSFAGRSKVSTWIMGVAYHKAVKAIGRLSRRPTLVEIAPDMAIDRASPERDVAERERHERIMRALAQLSPQHRAVVQLTFYDGLSYPEIAEIVGCPEGTVKTRMFHARKRLRALLSPEHELEERPDRSDCR